MTDTISLAEGTSIDPFETLEPASPSQFWLYAIMAVLATGTLMQFFRRKPANKLSNDDFVRAELIEATRN